MKLVVGSVLVAAAFQFFTFPPFNVKWAIAASPGGFF